jgi:hypothetical protein
MKLILSFAVFSELVAAVAFVHFYGEDSVFPVFCGFGYFCFALWAFRHFWSLWVCF